MNFKLLLNLFKGLFLCALFFFGGCLQTTAQEVIPTYSDYLTDNLYLLHPSMAGASNYNKIRLTARQQWFDVEDAPSLQTLNVHGRVWDKIGLGVIAFNDENGNFSTRGFYGTFAYHLLMSRSEFDLNQLSFGISGGLVQHSLDQSNFREFDPLVSGNNQSDYYANMDVGMSYYYHEFYAHATVKNILNIRRDLFFSDAVPSNQRKYLFSAGYLFTKNNSDWGYEPSVMLQLRDATKEASVDANFKVYKELENGSLWGGASFRRSFEGAEYTLDGEKVENQKLQYLTPFLGYYYKRFVFAYTYSYQMNSLVLSNSGFHQITLGYNFGKNRERWECECPAIN